MTAMAMRLEDVDLINPDPFQQGMPHDTWTFLRKEAPVFWHEGRDFPGFWAITKWEDIVEVSREPRVFISGKGVDMRADPTRPPEGMEAYITGQMMLTTDPPRHVQMRRLVNRSFTPREIQRMEPHVRELVRGILNDVCERGEADFVTDIAARLPVAIICEMMGVPEEDWHLMFEWTNRMIGADDPEFRAEHADAGQASMQASMEMFAYFARMMQERREHPTSDLMTVLLQSEIDGEKLSDSDVLLFGLLLIVAGNETTRNATSGGMLAFIDHPDQRARLAGDLSLINPAMEEVLRWVSPVIHFARICTEDTEIRGQKIRAGEKVILWYPSGNRDEDVFVDPFTFDITRSPNDHVAFGMGEHFCLGSHLARLELRVMFEEVFKRLPDLELSGPVHRLRSNFIAGIKHMPVKFTPTARV